MTPEEKARIEIDKMLEQAGWIVQDRSGLNIRASLGVAIREFVMKDNVNLIIFCLLMVKLSVF